MAVGVAGGVQDRRPAGVVDAGEGVRRRGGADRVDRDLDVAVGAVLEADRHREAGAELAVDLALGRAGADRPPGDRVGDVLRRDRVEELAADRQAEVEHLQQQGAGDAQAGVDVAGAVQVGVVDQALPAGRSPRLLEVDAHRDEQVVAELPRQRGQPPAVLERRLGVVHAAWADHDQQPVVDPFEHVLHRPCARSTTARSRSSPSGRSLEQGFRRHQLDHALDPLVANAVPPLLSHSDDHLAVAFLHLEDFTFR